MSESFNVTSAGIDPATDRQQRMRAYTIAMLIRTICVVIIFIAPGWWAVIPALGAIFLPSIAVMIANITAAPTEQAVTAVAPLALTAPQQPAADRSTPHTIVIDSFTDRRATGERLPDADA
ncbi:DUF3099 domain-containing protein [Canibacter oris]|uniref:DUF3099 domain-containing protein n=1 Tax=Canibacter oris TaxID=1365628 RepID=A0A840DJG5_9MICO|nr:DUF3099 domain-containing protein [Canibacter oris]MBB4071853.1 hypothetical protein [Canibacter oris]